MNTDKKLRNEVPSPREEPPKGFKERLYDQIKLPLWMVDLFIALLLGILIWVIYTGTR